MLEPAQKCQPILFSQQKFILKLFLIENILLVLV